MLRYFAIFYDILRWVSLPAIRGDSAAHIRIMSGYGNSHRGTPRPADAIAERKLLPKIAFERNHVTFDLESEFRRQSRRIQFGFTLR
jgi:hypothetical protein